VPQFEPTEVPPARQEPPPVLDVVVVLLVCVLLWLETTVPLVPPVWLSPWLETTVLVLLVHAVGLAGAPGVVVPVEPEWPPSGVVGAGAGGSTEGTCGPGTGCGRPLSGAGA